MGHDLGREREELSEEEKQKEGLDYDSLMERSRALEEMRGNRNAHLLHEGEPQEASSGHPEPIHDPIGVIHWILPPNQ